MDNGSALVAFGSDMSSLAVPGRFLSDEKSMRDLRQNVLKVPAGKAVQYFEILLRTRLLNNAVSGYEIIAHRKPL
jgi:hypothetical protein